MNNITHTDDVYTRYMQKVNRTIFDIEQLEPDYSMTQILRYAEEKKRTAPPGLHEWLQEIYERLMRGDTPYLEDDLAIWEQCARE